MHVFMEEEKENIIDKSNFKHVKVIDTSYRILCFIKSFMSCIKELQTV